MKSPYFLWDYDLNSKQIQAILHGKNKTEKSWLMARILTHAKFNDIFKYLTTEEIVSFFPILNLPKHIKKAWKLALTTWGYHV